MSRWTMALDLSQRLNSRPRRITGKAAPENPRAHSPEFIIGRRLAPTRWSAGCLFYRGVTRNAFALAPIRLRFCRTFEDMRGDAAFLQRFAELDAQKAGRGVAGDAGVEPVGEAAHHGGIIVEQLGQNRE